jgi:ubiquinone/menaquinone biosynthesis C-methylase UbiE
LSEILEVGSGALRDKGAKCLQGSNVLHVDRDRESRHLEVVCDVQHLPFRDASFNMVYMSHVLEHVPHPLIALNELRRVSQRLVIVTVPNREYCEKTGCDRDPTHLYSWTMDSFSHLVGKVFPEGRVRYTSRVPPKTMGVKRILHLLISRLSPPAELTAIYQKET